MVLKRLGWYKAIYIILRIPLENKTYKHVRKGSVLKTSAANISGQELHEKGLMDFSPKMLKSSKIISLKYPSVAKGTSCEDCISGR